MYTSWLTFLQVGVPVKKHISATLSSQLKLQSDPTFASLLNSGNPSEPSPASNYQPSEACAHCEPLQSCVLTSEGPSQLCQSCKLAWATSHIKAIQRSLVARLAFPILHLQPDRVHTIYANKCSSLDQMSKVVADPLSREPNPLLNPGSCNADARRNSGAWKRVFLPGKFTYLKPLLTHA